MKNCHFNFKNIDNYICEHIFEFCDYYDVVLVGQAGKLVGVCPIHCGDNTRAFSFYPNGRVKRGFWQCRTKGCHYKYLPTATGFCRGVLDRVYRRKLSINYTIAELERVFGVPHHKMIPKNEDIILPAKKPVYLEPVSKEHVISSIDIPCQYFLGRGHKEETLIKYSVGTCINPEKKLWNRAIIPIFNQKDQLLACITRNTTDNPNYLRWLDVGPVKETLYNYWEAIPHIRAKNSVIIVEGAAAVWRLYDAGIFNVVATASKNPSETQIQLIKNFGVPSYILYDNDEAGINGTKELCARLGRPILPPIDFDIGEENTEQLMRYYNENIRNFGM